MCVLLARSAQRPKMIINRKVSAQDSPAKQKLSSPKCQRATGEKSAQRKGIPAPSPSALVGAQVHTSFPFCCFSHCTAHLLAYGGS